MKIIFAIMLIIVLAAAFTGCQKAVTTTETAKTGVSADISDVDALNEDLDTSDLDGVDKDLDSLTW